MITNSFTWSTASVASAFALALIFGGCSSDSSPSTPSDGGTPTSTGGSKPGTGGAPSSNGGVTGSGGAGGAAACTLAVGTTCDGPEDCPSGQRCCGKFQQPNYVEIGCFDSCAAQQGDAGFMMGRALWFELCHPADTCEDSTASCTTSPYLPPSLSRCLPAQFAGMVMGGGPPDATLGHDKNAVNCGKSVCTASEQCCVRQPLDPYCAPRTATCDCQAPDGGSRGGAGGKPNDAGRPKDGGGTGGSPADAASDAQKTD